MPYTWSSCWPALRTLTSFVRADLIGVWLRSVITGNRPLRVRVFDPEADPASVEPSSTASSRIPVGVDRRPTDCLIRPDLKRHAFHPTRQLMFATLNIHSIANKVAVVSQCWRDHGRYWSYRDLARGC